VTTAQDIVTYALKANGIGGLGQQLSSADLGDGFFWLQTLLAQWQRKRWLVWHLVDSAVQSTGALNYSVGVGGAFNIARPDELEGAYVRLISQPLPVGQGFTIGVSAIGGPDPIGGPLPNVGESFPGVLNIDYQMCQIMSYEDYASVPLKGLQTWPGSVFYDSGYPLGLVYFYPIPNAQFELHIITKQTLQQFVSLTDAFAMPPEYAEALIWSLAARLRPAYGLPPDPTITAAMTAALATVRNANTQVPRLSMPDMLPMSGRGGAWWLGIGGSVGSGGGGFTLGSSTLG
jgi:hypothetical protein